MRHSRVRRQRSGRGRPGPAEAPYSACGAVPTGLPESGLGAWSSAEKGRSGDAARVENGNPSTYTKFE